MMMIYYDSVKKSHIFGNTEDGWKQLKLGGSK
jgi:hypothetical protein